MVQKLFLIFLFLLLSCSDNSSRKIASRGHVTIDELYKDENFFSYHDITRLLNLDPLARYQWHLVNRGQSNFSKFPGILDNDLRISDTISKRINGDGVKIAISDTGIDTSHEDLKDNFILKGSRTYNYTIEEDKDPVPYSKSALHAHGTMVAGIISAVSENNLGVRGVAPGSKFVGLRYVGAPSSTEFTVDQASADVDIFNYSYGSNQCQTNKVNSSYIDAIRWGVENLRDGKGAVYIKSAGNEFTGYADKCNRSFAGQKYYGNTNFDEVHSYPYMIVVGAMRANGKIASYSTPGSNIWVTAPGGETSTSRPAIMTTDVSGCDAGKSIETSRPDNTFEFEHQLNLNCNYTSRMLGTSAAAPMVSGVVALMLSVNPELSWRDVKHILAVTAERPPSYTRFYPHPGRKTILPEGYIYQAGWVQNNAGYFYHNWFGFGTVNADRAVRLAKNYSVPLPKMIVTEKPLRKLPSYTQKVKRSIPDFNSNGLVISQNIKHNLVIESVQISVSINHKSVKDLALELYSPSGTKSIIINAQNGITNNKFNYNTFGTNAFYGEKSLGDWKLKVVDTDKNDISGELSEWSIKIYGHAPEERDAYTVPSSPQNISVIESPKQEIFYSPRFKWENSTDKNIIRHEVSIGTRKGQSDIVEWFSVADANEYQFSIINDGVQFRYGTKYFFNVRSVNINENKSFAKTASWTVDKKK